MHKFLIAAATTAVLTSSALANQGKVLQTHSGKNCVAFRFSDHPLQWVGFGVQDFDPDRDHQISTIEAHLTEITGYDTLSVTVPCLPSLGPVHLMGNINVPPLPGQ